MINATPSFKGFYIDPKGTEKLNKYTPNFLENEILTTAELAKQSKTCDLKMDEDGDFFIKTPNSDDMRIETNRIYRDGSTLNVEIHQKGSMKPGNYKLKYNTKDEADEAKLRILKNVNVYPANKNLFESNEDVARINFNFFKEIKNLTEKKDAIINKILDLANKE